MTRSIWPAPIILLLVLAAPGLQADVYRWVDEDGVTQYSDYPPPEMESTRIDPTAGIASDPEPPARNNDAASGDGDGNGDEDDGPATVEEFCEETREELEMVQSDRDIRIKSEDGQLEPLEGEAREQRGAALQRQVDEHCS